MELLLSRLAYECIKFAVDVPTGTDFLYADYCNRSFEYNSDFNMQSSVVWGRINTAIQYLYNMHKVSTFTKRLKVVQGDGTLPYAVLSKDVGEVLNVVDVSSGNGSYTNLPFRRGRAETDTGVEDRVTIVGGIASDYVTVEYLRQPKRFTSDDIRQVTDTEDPNIDLSEYGITPAGFDYIVNYTEAKVIELVDPVISARKEMEANSILQMINQEPRFSQDHIGAYDGGI